MYWSPLERGTCHSSESTHIHGDFGEKVGYILYKPNEALDVIVVPWLPPFQDTVYLVRSDMYPVVVNVMSQAIKVFCIQLHLVTLKGESVLFEDLKHDLNVLLMILDSVGEYEDVVQIYMDVLSDLASEDVNH